MSPEARAKLAESNAAFVKRKAAQREVRRLRKEKKPVPVTLLAQAGLDATIAKTAGIARKRKVVVTVAAKAGPHEALDAIMKAMQGRATKEEATECVVVTVTRQQAAKELGIKNRRWMNKAELDEAINLATEKRDDGKKPGRLLELEELGRGRCKAAWDAWKAKQPKGV